MMNNLGKLPQANFDKVYDAFFAIRNDADFKTMSDTMVLERAFRDLKVKTDEDEEALLNKLVVEFTKRPLPSKIIRSSRFTIEYLIQGKHRSIKPQALTARIRTTRSGLDDVVKSLSRIVAKDELRPVMQSVYLDVEAKRLVATDATILLSMPYKLTGKSLCINPKTKFDKLDKNAKLYKGRYEIVEGEFPKYQEVIPSYSKHSQTIDLVEFLSYVKGYERLSKFFIEDDHFVVKLSGANHIIYIKSDLLSRMLTTLAEQEVKQIQFAWSNENPGARPVVIKCLEEPKMDGLVMPFALDQNEENYIYYEVKVDEKGKTKPKVKSKPNSKGSDSKKKALSQKAKALKLKLKLMKL